MVTLGMCGMEPLPLSIREEYNRSGLISRSFDLSDRSMLAGLNADAAIFEQQVLEMRSKGQYAVPYLVTASIRAVTHDPNLIDVVTKVLDTPDWVMWGANVRSGTPNEAGSWHVDLESVFWPSITVVIGVSGCTPMNATRVIPGSQSIPVAALDAVDAADDVAVLGAARAYIPDLLDPVTIKGFGDGRFFLFDARSWHSGQTNQSMKRCALFAHFQRADALRVPLMKDYRKQSFYRRPAAYIDGTGHANRSVAPGPHSGLLSRMATRIGL